MTVLFRACAPALLCAVLLALAACSGPTAEFTAADSVAGAYDSKDTSRSRACKPAPKCKPAPPKCKPAKKPAKHWKHQKHCQCKCNGKCHCKQRCKCPPPAPTNQAPVAVITAATVDGRHLRFSGAESTDADGTIVQYQWDFNSDGVWELSSNSSSAASTFGLGHHVVTLRVTDDEGATGTATFEFDATNQLPEAVISMATASGTTYQLSGEESRDWDGTIVQYEWDFDGDGVFDALSPEPTVSHSFPGGDWGVTLRVTDNDGGTGTASATVHGNFFPVADIRVVSEEAVPGKRTFFLSFAGSSDAEGAIFDAYVTINDGTPNPWDINDVLDVSIFEGDAPYTLVLTVRDGLWATGTALASVSYEDGVVIALP